MRQIQTFEQKIPEQTWQEKHWEDFLKAFESTGSRIAFKEEFSAFTIGKAYSLRNSIMIAKGVAELTVFDFHSNEIVAVIYLSQKLTKLNAVDLVDLSHDNFRIDTVHDLLSSKYCLGGAPGKEYTEYTIQLGPNHMKFKNGLE